MDATYTLGSAALDQSFPITTDNTECEFGLELYYDSALNTQVDFTDLTDNVAQAITLVQPVFSTPDKGVVDVDDVPFIRI